MFWHPVAVGRWVRIEVDQMWILRDVSIDFTAQTDKKALGETPPQLTGNKTHHLERLGQARDGQKAQSRPSSNKAEHSCVLQAELHPQAE